MHRKPYEKICLLSGRLKKRSSEHMRHRKKTTVGEGPCTATVPYGPARNWYLPYTNSASQFGISTKSQDPSITKIRRMYIQLHVAHLHAQYDAEWYRTIHHETVGGLTVRYGIRGGKRPNGDFLNWRSSGRILSCLNCSIFSVDFLSLEGDKEPGYPKHSWLCNVSYKHRQSTDAERRPHIRKPPLCKNQRWGVRYFI